MYMAAESKWRFCTSCGSRCELTDRFCAKCGSGLGGKQPPVECRTPDEEAGEIAAEMFDIKAFMDFCLSQPDDALLKIAKLTDTVPAMGENYPMLLFKFVALGEKAKKVCDVKGNAEDRTVQSICEKCLEEYVHARNQARLEEGGERVLRDLEPKLDEVAIMLEKAAPGRAMEILGETKLKYALHADRVSISNAVQNKLSNEELRELFEMWIKSPVAIRSALLGAVVDIGSISKRLTISLYEDTEIWGPGDRMNPIKGFLHLDKANEPGSHWSIK